MASSLAAPLPALAAALLLAAPAAARDFGAPGPHVTGHADVTFTPSFGPDLPARIHYPALAPGPGAPADPAGGPYPLVGHVHGQSLAPHDYDILHQHLASWGYVVASIGPLPGPLHSPGNASKLVRDLMVWVEGESADPASAFAGLVSDDAWSASGHSLGGAALEHLVALEPRVRAVIALEPFVDTAPSSLAKLAAFDGAALSISGSLDVIVPSDEHAHVFFETASALGRSAFAEIQGASHYGCIDEWAPGIADPLPHAEQLRLHKELVTSFLEAEIRGDEDAYAALLGEGAVGEPLVVESGCEDPPVWALESTLAPGHLLLGVAARAGEPALLAVGLPALLPTPFGDLGLDPTAALFPFAGALPAAGLTEALLPLPASASGITVHAQSAVVRDGFTVVLSGWNEFTVP